MTREQALKIMIGDRVKPIPFFNMTEPVHKLKAIETVHGIKHAQSQTGVFFLVYCKTGHERWLDAGWFDACV